MPINSVIRSKRKELELTQEQIADYLGVSAPAVNKWEKGATYPDVTLLPPLARILKIDLNTLLCFEEGMSSNEIMRFSTQLIEHMEKNGYESGFTMAIEKIKEYPNCAELIETIATTLEGALLLYGTGLENRSLYEEQILSFYESVAKGDDEKSRNKALYMLVSKYIQKEEYDKAQQMLDLLPERSALDKKQLQATLLRKQNKLPEAAELLERKLLTGINEVQMTIYNLLEVELETGNYENAEKLSKGLNEIVKQFDLWDYNAYVASLLIATKKQNVRESVYLLRSMLEKMMTPWNFQDSILYSHVINKKKQNPENQRKEINMGMKMLPTILSDLEKNPEFEFLHSDEEFIKLMKEYREKVEKPTDNNVNHYEHKKGMGLN